MAPSKPERIVACTGMKSPEGDFGDARLRCSLAVTIGLLAVNCT